MKVKLKTSLILIALIFLQPSYGFCESTPSYIAIYGDSRTGHDIHRQIVKAMLHYKPSVVFHTSDIVYLQRAAALLFMAKDLILNVAKSMLKPIIFACYISKITHYSLMLSTRI